MSQAIWSDTWTAESVRRSKPVDLLGSGEGHLEDVVEAAEERLVEGVFDVGGCHEQTGRIVLLHELQEGIDDPGRLPDVLRANAGSGDEVALVKQQDIGTLLRGLEHGPQVRRRFPEVRRNEGVESHLHQGKAGIPGQPLGSERFSAARWAVDQDRLARPQAVGPQSLAGGVLALDAREPLLHPCRQHHVVLQRLAGQQGGERIAVAPAEWKLAQTPIAVGIDRVAVALGPWLLENRLQFLGEPGVTAPTLRVDNFTCETVQVLRRPVGDGPHDSLQDFGIHGHPAFIIATGPSVYGLVRSMGEPSILGA